jgi:hypothetical protein
MDKTKSIRPIQLAEYKTPQMKEQKNGKLISYGKDNKYPLFLLDLYNNSAEHNALVNAKVDYAVGNGMELEQVPAEVLELFKKSDIDSLLTKIITDLEIFGGFAFKVCRNLLSDGIRKIEYVDFASIRVGSDGGLLVADDWELYRPNATQFDNWTSDGEGDQIYYYIGNSSRYSYPLPKYLGAISAIETDIEIQNFHLNHVKNGFFVPVIINFNNGVPEDAEQEEIEKDIEAKFCSPSKAGRFMLAFNEDKESAVSVERLQTDDLDTKFEILAKQIQQKILIGHRVTNPMLFGVKTEGQLGGRNELIEAYELFKTLYITPVRQEVLGAFAEVLGAYYGEVELQIIDQYPIENIISPDTVIKVMTDAEIRTEAGLEPIVKTEDELFIERLGKMPVELQKAVILTLTPEQLIKITQIPQ